VRAVRRGVAQPQRRLHRAGTVDEHHPPLGARVDRQRPARALDRRAGTGEDRRAQRVEVDRRQIPGDQQRAALTEPGAVVSDHVVDRDRRDRVGVAVQRAAVPLLPPEEVGAERCLGPRPGVGPLHAKRGRLVVAYPGDVRRVQARGANRLGEQRHRVGQPVGGRLHADPERVPVHCGEQLRAQALQRERVRGRVAPVRTLLQRLGHDGGEPFAAGRLAAGAGVEQQDRDRQGLARQVGGDHAVAAHDLGKAVRPGGTRPRTLGNQTHERSSVR
jgi:hypothetical protein